MSGGGATAKSNAQIGAENLERLAAWLDAAAHIPERVVAGRHEANVSAIAVAAEVDRQVCYRPEARELIRRAVERKGLGMPEQSRAPGGDAVPAWAAQRIKHLEEQVAVARAENADLRVRLRRFEHLARHMAETGMLAR